MSEKEVGDNAAQSAHLDRGKMFSPSFTAFICVFKLSMSVDNSKSAGGPKSTGNWAKRRSEWTLTGLDVRVPPLAADVVLDDLVDDSDLGRETGTAPVSG